MEKNKVAMAIVLGAIGAIAAAPSLLEQNTKMAEGEKESTSVAKNTIIDIKNNNKVDLPEEDKIALVDEVNSLLKRQSSLEELNDGYSLVLKGYGENNQSLQEEVYKELSLAFADDDSTMAGNNAIQPPGHPVSTVSFCHAACHYACHGSRGWR